MDYNTLMTDYEKIQDSLLIEGRAYIGSYFNICQEYRSKYHYQEGIKAIGLYFKKPLTITWKVPLKPVIGDSCNKYILCISVVDYKDTNIKHLTTTQYIPANNGYRSQSSRKFIMEKRYIESLHITNGISAIPYNKNNFNDFIGTMECNNLYNTQWSTKKDNKRDHN